MMFRSSLPAKMAAAFVWLLVPSVIFAGDGILIYQNTLGEFLYSPGRGFRIADDVTPWPGGVCALERLRIRVSGGVDGGGGTFLADLRLYDGCPSDGGIPISGTTVRFEDLTDDASITHDLLADFSDRGICADSLGCQVSQQNCADNSVCQADPLEIPPTVWVRIRFDTDDAGVLLGAPAQFGFSEDIMLHPRVGCSAWFGGWPEFPHASFWVEMFAGADCMCGADSECDDGQFCNGSETCRQDGRCGPGTSPCDAGFVCHEIDHTCRCDGNDDCAEDGLFCNGEEICEAGLCVSPGTPCTLPTPLCIEETDTCHCGIDTDCDDGDACNGVEFCDPTGACQNRLGPDCNANGIPDGCEPDCNGSGTPDDCDILDGTSLDCQTNGIPDECEEDCNNNGVPDDCDIVDGTSPDCQANGIPDECESFGLFSAYSGPLSPFTHFRPQTYTIVNPPEAGGFVRLDFAAAAPMFYDFQFVDVAINGNFVREIFRYDGNRCGQSQSTATIILDPSDFNAAVGGGDAEITMTMSTSFPACQSSFISVTVRYETIHLTNDCDNNGLPDECEIAAGTADDCQPNGIPDACDVVGRLLEHSGPLTPVGYSHPHTFTLVSPPPALSDVVLFFQTSANVAAPVEFIEIYVNSAKVGEVFRFRAGHCSDPPSRDGLVFAASLFNAAVDGGDAIIRLNPSIEVDPFVCSDEFISVSVAYKFSKDDCNENGVPDSCDVASMTSSDCQPNGIPDECEIDCNSNGVPDDCDLHEGTSQDCQPNGIPDDCETDCNSNTVPDDCDIRDGTSGDCNFNDIPDDCEDCNNNGIADDCDIADGASPDCNNNEIPDECDIQVGTSADCQSNGIPDECDTIGRFRSESGVLSPIHRYNPQSFTLFSPPRAFDRVSLSFTAKANFFNTDYTFINVDINGIFVGAAYEFGNDSLCASPPATFSLSLSADIYNRAVGGGDALFTLTPTSNVAPCDGSFIMVAIDYQAAGVESDCNRNRVPDVCEIRDGTSQDCQLNNIPDECDTVVSFFANSGELSPINNTNSQSFTLDSPPPTGSEVFLTFTAQGRFGPDGAFIDVDINGMPVGKVFQTGAQDCGRSPTTEGISVPASLFNHAVGIGDVVIGMTASSGVTSGCPSRIVLAVAYHSVAMDCNRNAVPDECELVSGTSADCQSNGIPDDCEVQKVFSIESNLLAPIDTLNPQSFTILAPPDAIDTVTFDFLTRAYVRASGAFISVFINNSFVFSIRNSSGFGCRHHTITHTLEASVFNSLKGDGDLVVDLVPSSQVFVNACSNSSINVGLVYEIAGNDCNRNDVPDECDEDCNSTGRPDACDIATGASPDCDSTGIPDECELAMGTSRDCNGNLIPDKCDIAFGASLDCQTNGIPDECDLLDDPTLDCPTGLANGIPDQCEADCQAPGRPGHGSADSCDVTDGTSTDCNNNGLPDECETDCNANGVPDDCDIVDGFSRDCNKNQTPDECDSRDGTSGDCQPNGVPDECETDCNANTMPDDCDIRDGGSLDCQSNGIPDECEIDCNTNGLPDDCDIANGASQDCNNNEIPDECDIVAGSSVDCQPNGVPDECEIAEEHGDCNGNGIPDDCDIADGSSDDCQFNGVPDECDVGFLFSRASGELSPFDRMHPKSYRINRPPAAGGDVTVTVSASADLSRISEFVEIAINGTIVHRAFGSLGVDCAVPPIVESFVVSPVLFNLLVDGGDATIDMLPSNGLDPGLCANTSIALSISYATIPRGADCNENGFPDPCDLSSGVATDCNLNAVPDECETDADGDGVADDCDACLDSDLSESVEIDGCPTGVHNGLLADGCTMNDLLGDCSLNAHNHGQFTSCVARLANEWRRNGLLSGKAVGGLARCAAASNQSRPSKRSSPDGPHGRR